MDLTVDKYAQRYDRMRAIATKRKRNRDTYKPESKCCDDADIKMVVAHGFWTDTVPHFPLPEGYKVIMLCQPGRKIRLNKRKLDEIRRIYLHGNSFFESNDTNPSRMTEQGASWFNGINCPCQARLYIGGVVDVGGRWAQTMVPNISLKFGGAQGFNTGYCDNWSGEINPTNPESTECKITCISPGTQTNCDKYYFDDGEEETTTISLEELLQNEGPGTYVIISCMSGHREILPPESLEMAENAREAHLLNYPQPPTYDADFREWTSGRGPVTRRKSKKVRKSMSELLRAYTATRQKEKRFARLSSLRSQLGGKKRKTRKHKTRKHKTKRHRTRRQ